MSKNSITRNDDSYGTNILIGNILETARSQQSIINELSLKIDSLDKILQSNSVTPVSAGSSGEQGDTGPAGTTSSTYFTKMTMQEEHTTETTKYDVPSGYWVEGSILIPHMTEDFAEENPHWGSWIVSETQSPAVGPDASNLVDNNSAWSCPKTGFYVIHFQASVTSWRDWLRAENGWTGGNPDYLYKVEIQVICTSLPDAAGDTEMRTIGIGGTNWGGHDRGYSISQVVNATCQEKIEFGEDVQFNVTWTVRKNGGSHVDFHQNRGVILGKEGTGVIIWELK